MNFYEVLGVDEDADGTAIKQAFRERARRYHPDVNDHPRASEQFTVLSKARDVLTDPEERNAYDRLGHADYVSKRLDGDLPDPPMDPEPSDEAEDPGASSDGTSTGSQRSSSTGSTSQSSSRSGTATSGGSASGGTASGSSSSGSSGRSASGDTSGRSASGGTASSGSASGGTATSSDGGNSASSGTNSASAASSSTGTSSGSSSTSGSSTSGSSTGDSAKSSTVGGGKAHSTPPTPGNSEGTTNTPSGGGSAAGGGETPEAARRRRAETDASTGHLTVSRLWVGVLATAGLYLLGAWGYLGANRAGVDALVADLTAGDPARLAAALGSARYEVPDVLAYTDATGLFVGLAPSAGVVVLAGAALLPLAMAAAVVQLRRRTTWRPSYLHVVGALGPATSVGLAHLTATDPGALPVEQVPLLVDLLLLVAFPGVVVASFLLNRLVLVMPLRRREELRQR